MVGKRDKSQGSRHTESDGCGKVGRDPTPSWAWACSLRSGFRSLSLEFHESVLGPGSVSQPHPLPQGPEESLHSCRVPPSISTRQHHAEMNMQGFRERGATSAGRGDQDLETRVLFVSGTVSLKQIFLCLGFFPIKREDPD